MHVMGNLSIIYIYLYILYIQAVPGGMDKIRESVSYVKI